MEETAAAIKQIGENVKGVKEKAMSQAAGVTETVATVEQINGRLSRLVSGNRAGRRRLTPTATRRQSSASCIKQARSGPRSPFAVSFPARTSCPANLHESRCRKSCYPL